MRVCMGPEVVAERYPQTPFHYEQAACDPILCWLRLRRRLRLPNSRDGLDYAPQIQMADP